MKEQFVCDCDVVHQEIINQVEILDDTLTFDIADFFFFF